MKRLISEKESENNELLAHLQEMEVSVSERQKIYEIQSQNTSSNPSNIIIINNNVTIFRRTVQ